MPVIKKESKLYSIVFFKCPKCHNGDLFINKNPYLYKTMLSMPPKCNVCGQGFVFESGFYSAALWTSYPIVLVLAAAIILIFFVGLHISGFWLIGITAIILLSLQPYIMRLGRAILINHFVDYEPTDPSGK